MSTLHGSWRRTPGFLYQRAAGSLWGLSIFWIRSRTRGSAVACRPGAQYDPNVYDSGCHCDSDVRTAMHAPAVDAELLQLDGVPYKHSVITDVRLRVWMQIIIMMFKIFYKINIANLKKINQNLKSKKKFNKKNFNIKFS